MIPSITPLLEDPIPQVAKSAQEAISKLQSQKIPLRKSKTGFANRLGCQERALPYRAFYPDTVMGSAFGFIEITAPSESHQVTH